MSWVLSDSLALLCKFGPVWFGGFFGPDEPSPSLTQHHGQGLSAGSHSGGGGGGRGGPPSITPALASCFLFLSVLGPTPYPWACAFLSGPTSCSRNCLEAPFLIELGPWSSLSTVPGVLRTWPKLPFCSLLLLIPSPFLGGEHPEGRNVSF